MNLWNMLVLTAHRYLITRLPEKDFTRIIYSRDLSDRYKYFVAVFYIALIPIIQSFELLYVNCGANGHKTICHIAKFCRILERINSSPLIEMVFGLTPLETDRLLRRAERLFSFASRFASRVFRMETACYDLWCIRCFKFTMHD